MLGYPPYPALSGVGGEAKAYYCIQDPSQNGQITMDRADYGGMVTALWHFGLRC